MSTETLRWLQEEVERLRTDYELLACNTDELQRRRKENDYQREHIEALRGLLREADTALSLMPLPTRKFGDLRRRICEALGHG